MSENQPIMQIIVLEYFKVTTINDEKYSHLVV